LTYVGLVPASLIGLDLDALLASAQSMAGACREPDPAFNPGVTLGLAIGTLAKMGRDKLTFVADPAIESFGAWAEQLIAESTGKDRKGIIPVANEALGSPEKYGEDRFFVYLRLSADENHLLDRQVAALEANGHPVARIDIDDKTDLGQEFFRWEVAVAAAGAALGIHPFNQPDVQLAKDLAKKAMEKIAAGKKSSSIGKDEAVVADRESFQPALSAWLGSKKPRDYIAVQAYLNPSPEHTAKLQEICTLLRDRLGVATTLGYGPRFLHSTGQLHKGGPNSVLVLQIVDQPTMNLSVPETNYTFDALIQAQALGDFTALKQRRRRALRVNLGSDTESGLNLLTDALRP
jgi:transaldolase/glucose-6-phosphate isomerase